MSLGRPGGLLCALVAVGACGSSGSPATMLAEGGATAEDGPAPLAPDGSKITPADTAAPLTSDAGPQDGPSAAPDAPPVSGPDGPPIACGVCAAYAPAQRVGEIQDPSLNAVSGIAASWRNPGLLYVHNDRDRPEFVAVTEAGAVAGRFTLTGGAVRDVEDIAVGRCPAGTCVHLADLGNNIAARPDFVILRVPEPVITPGMVTTATLAAERLVFTYPDGPHNAESLLVDPGSGALYVITKVAAGARSAVYKLPAFGAGGAATKVADLPVPAAGDQPATAGDAHPCGAGFLLRTNNTAYEFRIPMGTPFEEAFKVAPTKVPFGNEAQSEGITYARDGRGYYTTSEGPRPPIHRVGCQ